MNTENTENNIYSITPPLPPLRTTCSSPVSVIEFFEEGKFTYIKDPLSREMLVNAWNAITQLNLWDYMKEKSDSYMLSNDNQVNLISEKMCELGYNGHSGFSFGWTMRQMQFIAINGEDVYMKQIIS